MFGIISSYLLKNGGSVFGVAMKEDFSGAYHTLIRDSQEIKKLEGSKYIPSSVGDIYKQVKSCLNKGDKVLFSGTPCQIVALKRFLKSDYDNLFCIDVVCHGVPSEYVWRKYLKESSLIKKNDVESISFRTKEAFLRKSGFSENVKFVHKDEDYFLRLFLSDCCLRPSCYCCPVKEYGYESDITLGDFWAINRIAHEFNDGKGISLVIIRTEKGRKLFDTISDRVESIETDYDDSVRGNAIEEQTNQPQMRTDFFEDLYTHSIVELVKKYAPISKKKKIKRILREVGLLNIVPQRETPVAEFGMGYYRHKRKEQ